tara:strand:+ start:335 stop:2203 length:1869 start_codon:yes stop_codon:yes gene_type:complete
MNKEINLEDKDIVNIILRELSKLCTIPKDGFLAGGAVANTLLSMKYGKDYPINDLDVFIEDTVENVLTQSYNTPERSNGLVVQDGYYSHELSYDHGSNYKILKVNRDGLLNTIVISRINNRNIARDYQYILNGFDFNCCQVGIDLNNNILHYTDEFIEFLNTKQLDITAVYTPAHTAIRLFKKKKELDCYCNIEKCLEILSQPLIRENRVYLSSRYFGFYFSHKYKDMFMEYYKEIKTYFKIVRFFEDKKEMFYLRNKHMVTTPNDQDHVANWLNPHNSISKDDLEKWSKYNDIMWTLEPIKYSKASGEINKYLKNIQYNPLTLMCSYKLIGGKLKKSLVKKYDIVVSCGEHTKLISFINIKFCDCDFTKEHIFTIENYINQTPAMLNIILLYNLNIQETIKLITNIKKIQNKEGLWVEGLIIELLVKGNKNIKPTYESISLLIKENKENLYKPLVDTMEVVEHINLSSDIEIKEIISEGELMWAGHKLKNCLNDVSQGYVNKISSGKVKVFLIKTKNSVSALELHLSTELDLYVTEKQLLSYCNKTPSRYHRIIADILINELNSDLLKNNYQKRLGIYKDIITLNRGLLVSTEDEKTDKNEDGTPDIDVMFGDDEIDEMEF